MIDGRHGHSESKGLFSYSDSRDVVELVVSQYNTHKLRSKCVAKMDSCIVAFFTSAKKTFYVAKNSFCKRAFS